MGREHDLTDAFVELADTLVNDYELGEFLQMLTYRSAGILRVDAVGVVLAGREGRLDIAAASTDDMLTLELFQMQDDEGPCRDAFHTGRQVVETDLSQAADRWPTFVLHAKRAGYAAVHAFPMRLRGQVLGALDLFSEHTGPRTEAEVHTAQALADMATIGILHRRAVRDAETLSEELQHALDTRVVIEQAKGILMQREKAAPQEAFEALRRYARTHKLRVHDVAQALIDETVPPEMLVQRH